MQSEIVEPSSASIRKLINGETNPELKKQLEEEAKKLDFLNLDNIHFATSIDINFVAERLTAVGKDRGKMLKALVEAHIVTQDQSDQKLQEEDWQALATQVAKVKKGKQKELQQDGSYNFTVKHTVQGKEEGKSVSLKMKPRSEILLETLKVAAKQLESASEAQKKLLQQLSTSLHESKKLYENKKLAASFEGIQLEPVPVIDQGGRQETYDYSTQKINMSFMPATKVNLKGNPATVLMHEMVHAYDDIYENLQSHTDCISSFAGQKNWQADLESAACLISDDLYKDYMLPAQKNLKQSFSAKVTQDKKAIRYENGVPTTPLALGEFLTFYAEKVFEMAGKDEKQIGDELANYFKGQATKAQQKGFVVNDGVKEFLLKVNEELGSIPEFQHYTNIAKSVIQELKFDNPQQQSQQKVGVKNIYPKQKLSDTPESEPQKKIQLSAIGVSMQQQHIGTPINILQSEIYDGVYEHLSFDKKTLVSKDGLSNLLQTLQNATFQDQTLSIKAQKLKEILEKQQKQNLRKWGKGSGEREMMDELMAENMGKADMLSEIKDRVQEGVDVQGRQGDRKTGKVELLGEVHDAHGGSVKKLMGRMERGEMGAGTVIALERKEGGEHLGMRDVRLLAEVMRHNEGRKEAERIKLPVGMEGIAIWWDAKLVNEARKHEVQVVGVEGKGLAHDQHSPEYNKDREYYMAQQLAQLKHLGYDVIMPVGATHVQGLRARLNADAAMETMQNMRQQKNNTPPPQNHAQSTHTTANAKQVYGKFTEQVTKKNAGGLGM